MWGIGFLASQPRGCAGVQTPAQRDTDFKGCGLDSLMYKHKLSLPHTHTRANSFNHTYTHILNTHGHSLSTKPTGFLGPRAATHRELCAGRWVGGTLGGGAEAWLSAPVFATVIRGARYFGVASVHADAEAHRERSEGRCLLPGSCCCFLCWASRE